MEHQAFLLTLNTNAGAVEAVFQPILPNYPPPLANTVCCIAHESASMPLLIAQELAAATPGPAVRRTR